MQLTEKLHAVHSGHAYVEQHQVWWIRADLLEAGGAVSRLLDAVTLATQRLGHDGPDRRVVVDDQNALPRWLFHGPGQMQVLCP